MKYTKRVSLEDRIIGELKEGSCSVERALLAVSGLETEDEIAVYTKKIDLIQKDFESRYCEQSLLGNKNELQTARALFDYFWETKPNRYNGDFLLAKVIDNQLDEDKNKRVGNCVGLTSLYSVLGIRLGLELSVLVDEWEEGGVNGSHCLSLLSCNSQEIAVENTDKYGFNIEFKSGYEKTDLIYLVASVLFSKGYVKWYLGDLNGALLDYNRAIELKPDYAFAFNNRGCVKEYLGDLNGALLDYNRTTELNPDNANAFNSKGNVKQWLDDLNGALSDYNKAIELNPDNAGFKRNKRWLLRKLNKKP